MATEKGGVDYFRRRAEMSAQSLTVKVFFNLTGGVLTAVGATDKFTDLFVTGRTGTDPLALEIIHPNGAQLLLRYPPNVCQLLLYGLDAKVPEILSSAEGFAVKEVTLKYEFPVRASRPLKLGMWTQEYFRATNLDVDKVTVDMVEGEGGSDHFAVSITGSDLDDVLAAYMRLRAGELGEPTIRFTEEVGQK